MQALTQQRSLARARSQAFCADASDTASADCSLATRRSVFGFPAASGVTTASVGASVSCAAYGGAAAYDDGGEVSSATGARTRAPAPARASFAPYREHAAAAEEEERGGGGAAHTRKRSRDVSGGGDDDAGVWRRDCALRYDHGEPGLEAEGEQDDGGWGAAARGAAAAGGALLVSRQRFVFAADSGAADASAGSAPSWLAALTVQEALLLPDSPGGAFDAPQEAYDCTWHAVRRAHAPTPQECPHRARAAGFCASSLRMAALRSC
jgi:hypothetical protein